MIGTERTRQLGQPLLMHEDHLIQERNRGMEDITYDLGQLREAMVDLHSLVGEQTEGIETIHANTEQTDAYVEVGLQELKQAKVYQNRSRRKLVCFSCLFLTGVAILREHRKMIVKLTDVNLYSF